jgi:large subunit ribosomal protein L1
MNKETIQKALKELREKAKKRNFTQSIDLIFNLKGLNLKNAEQQMDFYLQLHYDKGKAAKVCALVGPELQPEASKVCDKTITQAEFDKFAKDKKLIKKLAEDYDFFIAQANIMAKVATTFGRVFGPRKKMPNPKAGCVVPPKASLKPLYERLQKTVRVYAKEKPLVQLAVGNEGMKDEEIIDNVMTAYDFLIHHLPAEKNNIKSVFIKLTMGAPVSLG